MRLASRLSVEMRHMLLSFLCLATVGCQGDQADWLMPGLSRVSPQVAMPDSSWVAVPIREYGELDGPLAFARPYAVVALADGALVVSDAFTCILKVIERPEGKLRSQWGGCGDGPGEFRFIRAMAVDGDSIFVYDQGRSEIVVMSANGSEGRRMPVIPPRQHPGPFSLSHIDVVDDSTLVVGTEGSGYASVALMDRGTGNFRRTLLDPPPIATFSNAWIRHVGGVCVGTQEEGDGATVVAVSEWALEGVGLSPGSGAERFHFLTDLDLGPRLRNDGIWAPGPRDVDVRCGESLLLSRVTTLAPEDRNADMATVRAAMVVLEARGYDGRLLMRWWIDDRDSLLRGIPSAFLGDTLFVVSSRIRPYPIVGEIVIRPATRSGGAERRRLR